MKAVLIGRFQPFHKGHLKISQELFRRYGNLTIIIGSSEESGTKSNPLSFEQRKNVISETLSDAGINAEMTGMKDFLDDKKWAEEILKIIDGSSAVYTKNPWVRRCLESLGIRCRSHRLFYGISGRKIRKAIRSGNEWKSMIPEKALKVIEREGYDKLIEREEFRRFSFSDAGKIVSFIRRETENAGASGAVLGLSGGIDSYAVAALARKALGERVLCLLMPANEGSKKLAEELGAVFENIDMKKISGCLLSSLGNSDNISEGNLSVRLRMAILYYYANSRKLLVIGTSNRSEMLTGYYTKFGDSAGDIQPIAGLYKTQVFDLARKLGAPKWLLEKKPSAGFHAGQTDESELGMKYDKLDSILHNIFDLKKEPSTPDERKVFDMAANARHKKGPRRPKI